MGRCLTLLLVMSALLSAGCAQRPPHGGYGTDSSLQHWLDAELAPYLAQQLGEHPRFKGETVVLVAMDGHDIRSDIDGLTRSLRAQLMDTLLTEPGVRVPWQPQQQAQHHRQLDEVECRRLRDANYYLGIEITRTATAQHRVSVRALDVRAGEWVGGFGKSWSGPLTAGELRAQQERRTDESLRGLRVLPFRLGHPDMAATYLANNLSCLLRQRAVEDLVIYVESLNSDQPQLRTLLRLIGNNLSRFREVQVTDAREEANFFLRGEVHDIQTGLRQVWVVLHPKNSGEHLLGMDTATYVRSQLAGRERVSRPMDDEVRSQKPVIADMQLVRRHGQGTVRDECPAQQADGVRGGVAPCPVLELSVERADQLFVFVHGTKDGLSRLSSGACSDSTGLSAAAPARRSYSFPATRFAASDWLTVYAIAVSGEEPRRQFKALIQALPDACGSRAGMGADSSVAEQWLAELDSLMATHEERAVWLARRIP